MGGEQVASLEVIISKTARNPRTGACGDWFSRTRNIRELCEFYDCLRIVELRALLQLLPSRCTTCRAFANVFSILFWYIFSASTREGAKPTRVRFFFFFCRLPLELDVT